MAKDMLDRQYEQTTAMAWETMNKAMESNTTLYKEVEKYVPKMFTPEEVIAQAEKLQSFINKKEGS
tara:strand:+ start:503 stop:700 length:198 start_codon:yes stop_codon:yes gene_type:complete